MMTSCPECGVPEYITSEHIWLDNGDIVHKRHQEHRMLFIESQNFDPLIRGIEEIIGVSIERFVMDAMGRAVRMYLEYLIPDEIRERVRVKEMSPKPLDDAFIAVGMLLGFGKYEFVDMRYERDEDDYYTVSITDPYCLPMCATGHRGAVEAILGYEHGVISSEVAPAKYNLTAFPAERPEELLMRLPLQLHHHVEGDIELERCATCGGPKGLSALTWYLDRGVIMDESRHRRLNIQGPHELEPVFRELEAELGEDIPRIVVEAQKRFVKTGFFSPEEINDVEALRDRLAVLGRGNLRELKIGRHGLDMHLDNACLALLIVGMMQGLYETAYDVDSGVEWELGEEGNLQMEVKPTR